MWSYIGYFNIYRNKKKYIKFKIVYCRWIYYFYTFLNIVFYKIRCIYILFCITIDIMVPSTEQSIKLTIECIYQTITFKLSKNKY